MRAWRYTKSLLSGSKCFDYNINVLIIIFYLLLPLLWWNQQELFLFGRGGRGGVGKSGERGGKRSYDTSSQTHTHTHTRTHARTHARTHTSLSRATSVTSAAPASLPSCHLCRHFAACESMAPWSAKRRGCHHVFAALLCRDQPGPGHVIK